MLVFGGVCIPVSLVLLGTQWTTDQPIGVLSPGRVEKLGARNVFLLVAGLWRFAPAKRTKRLRGIWGSRMYIAVSDSRVGCVCITCS